MIEAIFLTLSKNAAPCLRTCRTGIRIRKGKSQPRPKYAKVFFRLGSRPSFQACESYWYS